MRACQGVFLCGLKHRRVDWTEVDEEFVYGNGLVIIGLVLGLEAAMESVVRHHVELDL